MTVAQSAEKPAFWTKKRLLIAGALVMVVVVGVVVGSVVSTSNKGKDGETNTDFDPTVSPTSPPIQPPTLAPTQPPTLAPGSWSQVGQTLVGDAKDVSFRFSLALSADGTIMATGTHVNSDNGFSTGHVQVHRLNSNSLQLGTNGIDARGRSGK